MSTATQSFMGARLLESIPLARKSGHALPQVRLRMVTSRKYGRGIVIRKTATLRFIYFSENRSFWYPRTASIARELRQERLRRARWLKGIDNLSRTSVAQMFCQTVDSHAQSLIPREAVPFCTNVSDDSLDAALDWCRKNYFTTAGYGSSLPQGVEHYDSATDTFIRENIFDVPARLGARHATVKRTDFDSAVKDKDLSRQYRLALKLALVAGLKFSDAAKLSGRSYETFKKQAQRIRKSIPSEAFIPKEHRLQPEQWAKGFGEVGVRYFKGKELRTSDGVRHVPYDDGEAVGNDFLENERIFG